MKRTLLAAFVAITALAPAAFAQEPTRQERREARQAARKQDAEEWRSAWSMISMEDRATLATAWRNSVERIDGLTPEQKRRLRATAEEVGQQLRSLTPEQKRHLQERLQRAAASYSALNAEQKQQLLTQMSDAIERPGDLTPAQKDRLRALYHKLIGA